MSAFNPSPLELSYALIFINYLYIDKNKRKCYFCQFYLIPYSYCDVRLDRIIRLSFKSLSIKLFVALSVCLNPKNTSEALNKLTKFGDSNLKC